MKKYVLFAVSLLSAVSLYGYATELPPTGRPRATAEGLVYDNEESGLTATNVQSAIDELLTRIGLAVGHTIRDEGTLLTQRSSLNFTGSGVTCSDNSGTSRTDCNIPGSSGGHTIQNEGSALTARTGLNFIGTTVNCTDNSGSNRTDCTFTNSSGHTIVDESSSLTQRTKLTFTGAGVSCTDLGSGPDATQCAISGAGLDMSAVTNDQNEMLFWKNGSPDQLATMGCVAIADPDAATVFNKLDCIADLNHSQSLTLKEAQNSVGSDSWTLAAPTNLTSTTTCTLNADGTIPLSCLEGGGASAGAVAYDEGNNGSDESSGIVRINTTGNGQLILETPSNELLIDDQRILDAIGYVELWEIGVPVPAVAAFIGPGSTTDVIDLQTAEVAGNLGISHIVTSTNRDASHFLRGDGTWQVVSGGVTAFDDLTDVTLTSPASGNTITYNGSVWLNSALNLASSNAVTGNLPIGNIVTSTNRDSTHFLRGDGTWQTVTGVSAGFDTVTTGTNTTATMTVSSGASLVFNTTTSGTGAMSGTDTLGGNPALAANSVTVGTTGLIFEGATANASEGLLTPTDPTADQTWTLPDVTGTIAVATASSTATQALFATSTSGAPAYRRPATTDLSDLGTGVQTALTTAVDTSGGLATHNSLTGPTANCYPLLDVNSSGFPLTAGAFYLFRPGRAIHLTKMCAIFDDAGTLQLQRQDGSPVNALTTALTVSTSTLAWSGSAWSGSANMACTGSTPFVSGEDAIGASDFVTATKASGFTAASQGMICLEYTVD